MKKYSLQQLRDAWGAGFGIGKKSHVQELSTEDIEKREWNYKSRPSYPTCFLCLNFMEARWERATNKEKTRYTMVGECARSGWIISGFDVCDCWQDDA